MVFDSTILRSELTRIFKLLPETVIMLDYR